MQIFNISLSTQSVVPVFDAVQYDSGKECGFFVLEDISSYDKVEALFSISEGRTVPAACIVDDHLVSFVLPINLTRVYGRFTAVIRFINSIDSTADHTFPFQINVVKNPNQDGDTYERAYEDMVAENIRAEANNAQMESYISAYGSITPAQLTSFLSDLQNIWAQFNGQSMTTIGNRLTAMEDGLSTAQSDISDLQQAGLQIQGVISDLSDAVSALTQQMQNAQSAISTLETLANSAVYHD